MGIGEWGLGQVSAGAVQALAAGQQAQAISPWSVPLVALWNGETLPHSRRSDHCRVAAVDRRP